MVNRPYMSVVWSAGEVCHVTPSTNSRIEKIILWLLKVQRQIYVRETLVSLLSGEEH